MRRLLLGLAGLALAGGAMAALANGAGGPGRAPEVRAVPVHAQPVASGVRLTVHVFDARSAKGGPKGPKGPKGPPQGGGDVCVDGDQSAYALFAGARQGGLSFRLSNAFAPAPVAAGAPAAIGRSLSAWDAVIPGSYFSVVRDDVAVGPARDGVSRVGWARLVPKGTLAAAWTYTDAATGRVVEADVLFNTSQPWGILSGCGAQAAYDLESVATHETGHVLGLEHVSDPGRAATMYPSAPAGEIRKRTLTAGDVAGVTAALE